MIVRRGARRFAPVVVGVVLVGGVMAFAGQGDDHDEVVVAATVGDVEVVPPPAVDDSPSAIEAARERGLVLAGARDDGTPWGYVDMEDLNAFGRRRSTDPTLVTELELTDADGSQIGVVVPGFNRPISLESWADPELRAAITGEAEAGVVAESERRATTEQHQE